MTSLEDRVAAQPWYHTIELGPGVVTPGEYDLRAVAARLPWPDLRGRRCLDVGSRDGFYAFEMERRGAAEVVSLDLDDPADIDFPGGPPPRESVQGVLDAGSAAFTLAREALGSRVQRHHRSIYALTPEEIGSFDFAVIGTLLLHLRDPLRCLTSVRALSDRLLAVEAVAPSRTLRSARPSAEFSPVDGPFWWLPNPACLLRWITFAGYEVERSSRPFLVPRGGELPEWGEVVRRPLRELPRRAVMRRGMPHVWVLTR